MNNEQEVSPTVASQRLAHAPIARTEAVWAVFYTAQSPSLISYLVPGLEGKALKHSPTTPLTAHTPYPLCVCIKVKNNRSISLPVLSA